MIYSTKYHALDNWSFVWKNIPKLSRSRLFKQDTEGSSISVHFKTGFHCIIGDSYYWEVSSDHPGGMRAHYNFARGIQQCLQLNGRHLEPVLSGSSWYYWFIFETKSFHIPKYHLLPFNKFDFYHLWSLICTQSFCFKNCETPFSIRPYAKKKKKNS